MLELPGFRPTGVLFRSVVGRCRRCRLFSVVAECLGGFSHRGTLGFYYQSVTTLEQFMTDITAVLDLISLPAAVAASRSFSFCLKDLVTKTGSNGRFKITVIAIVMASALPQRDLVSGGFQRWLEWLDQHHCHHHCNGLQVNAVCMLLP